MLIPDIKKSISWYQEIEFLISRNQILDIKNWILDIKKSNSWYQEMNSWYQEIGLNVKGIV